MQLYADASYFIALADPGDPWHDDARGLVDLAETNAPLHIHALALGEVIAVVGSALGGTAARDVYLTLRDTTILHCPTEADLDTAMEHVVRYDGTVSLSDALYLDWLLRERGSAILSFDTGFDGKGVQRATGKGRKGRRRRRRR